MKAIFVGYEDYLGYRFFVPATLESLTTIASKFTENYKGASLIEHDTLDPPEVIVTVIDFEWLIGHPYIDNDHDLPYVTILYGRILCDRALVLRNSQLSTKRDNGSIHVRDVENMTFSYNKNAKEQQLLHEINFEQKAQHQKVSLTHHVNIQERNNIVQEFDTNNPATKVPTVPTTTTTTTTPNYFKDTQN
jgi:hypothetical protein